MSTPDAAWWRAYRLRRAEELRAYNRERRRLPAVRSQRHASEARRRARIRAAAPADVPLAHPLLTAAAALVVQPRPGRVLRFRGELTAEDARSEAALALLEGRDAQQAVKAYRTAERRYELHHLPMLAEVSA